MGTIKKGILGGFSGKVANVVGASWRGISYMRSLPSKVRNPRTKKQVAHRTRFSLMGKFVRALLPVLQLGFNKTTATGESPYSNAMSYNIQNAVKGEYPNWEIDYPKVALSMGTLHLADDAAATCEAGKLIFTWDKAIFGNAEESDRVVMIAYNPSRGKVFFDEKIATRGLGTAVLPLPLTWSGQEVEAFVFFTSENGSLLSKTAYAGNLKVLNG